MKTKRTLAEARAAADELCYELRHLVDRIEVAGSVRRGKAEVGDLEIVAIPKHAVDLFGEPLQTTLVDGWLSMQPPNRQPTKNGPRYKQFRWRGYQVDLFLATPENYGYIFMLRTGPAAFSQRMVTHMAWGGFKPADLTVRDGMVSRGGVPLSVPDEATLFDLYGMAYIPPELRGVAEVQRA